MIMKQLEEIKNELPYIVTNCATSFEICYFFAANHYFSGFWAAYTYTPNEKEKIKPKIRRSFFDA